MMQHIGKVFNAALNKKKKNYATCIGCLFKAAYSVTMNIFRKKLFSF